MFKTEKPATPAVMVCDACGLRGGAVQRILLGETGILVCVDHAACVRRFRKGLTAEEFAELLRTAEGPA